MKNIYLIFLVNFALISCSTSSTSVSVPKSVSNTITDFESLYPSANTVIQHHSEWTKKHYVEKIAEFKANPLEFGDIVFIGNSITEQGGNWGKRFDNPKVKNRGISGDVTAGVLKRLGEINYYKPKKVFLKIGINDLFKDALTPEYVANNIKAIVAKIHLESPNTKIYVQTILPTTKNNPKKEIIKATNDILKAMPTSKNLQIIDLHSIFADQNDLMISSYTSDGLHLNESGYNVWKNYIIDFVNN